MVVASIALFVALAGTSVAAVSQLVPRNSVGTPQLRNNAVVSAKVRNGSLLRADFRSGQIPAGPAGPAGPQGPAGPAGPAGAAATSLWAVVDQNGTLIRNKGVASAQKIGGVGTGDYQVVFNQDVTGCSYQATIGPPGNAPVTVGQADVLQRVNVAAGVEVRTLNPAGTAQDLPFHLAVFC